MELMCHPGYPCDSSDQFDEFSQSNDRQIEYEILASDELKTIFNRYNIEICLYEDFVFSTKTC